MCFLTSDQYTVGLQLGADMMRASKETARSTVLSSIISKGGTPEEMQKMMVLFGVAPDM